MDGVLRTSSILVSSAYTVVCTLCTVGPYEHCHRLQHLGTTCRARPILLFRKDGGPDEDSSQEIGLRHLVNRISRIIRLTGLGGTSIEWESLV